MCHFHPRVRFLSSVAEAPADPVCCIMSDVWVDGSTGAEIITWGFTSGLDEVEADGASVRAVASMLLSVISMEMWHGARKHDEATGTVNGVTWPPA